jgi:hypothetical protein
MVLLTLLMALELIQRVVASPTQQTIVQTRQSGQSLAEMQAEITTLQQRLESSNLIAENLPSFDPNKLREDRQQLEANGLRLQRDLIELNERVMHKQKELADVDITSASQRKLETEEIERLQNRNSEMRQALNTIKSSNRIFFNKNKDGKATWLVEVTGSQVLAAEIGVNAKPQQFATQHEFLNWLKTLSPPSTALYIILKPDGTPIFEAYKENIRSKGFDLGFHVVAADQQVIDPTTGAATP